VLTNAKCFEDKLSAYYTKVVSLESTTSSIKIGLDVLAQLGEHFPRSDEVCPDMVLGEIKRTRRMLTESGPIDSLTDLTEMTDRNKAAAMLFLARLLVYDFVGDQKFYVFFTCRMVQLTLSSGIHKESSFGFASFGSVLLQMQAADAREIHMFGKVAMSILQRCDARDCLARVYLIVWGHINVWMEPVQASLEMYLYAHEVGLVMGDVWHACQNGHYYTAEALFQSGIDLNQLLEEANVFGGKMKEHGLRMALVSLLPLQQAMSNLMGRSRDPTELTGEVMNQEEFLKVAHDKGSIQAILLVNSLRLWLAVFFHKHELAGTIIEQFEQSELSKRKRPRRIRNETFYKNVLQRSRCAGSDAVDWQKTLDVPGSGCDGKD